MIEEAIKIAKRSRCGKYAMGCVIYDNFDLKKLSNGWAHIPEMKNWPLYSLHAELHALARARQTDVQYAVAYIAAISRKSGGLTTARPCRDCAIALFAAGIDTVIYTMPSHPSNPVFKSEVIDLYDLETFKVYNSPQS